MAGKEFTHLLLSTTYALNKSYSKRVIVGLEYHSGRYRVVVKFCGTGTPSKYVTLNSFSWEILTDQMDAIDSYLNHSYGFYQEYGTPNKIFLENHDLFLTSAYGARAVTIEERPTTVNLREPQDQNNVEQDDGVSGCKKRKYSVIPSITMHSSTFGGLKAANECIKLRMKVLEDWSGYVNQYIDGISEFLKNKLIDEDIDTAKKILNNFEEFKKFYALNRIDISNHTKTFGHFDEQTLNIFLEEVYAYGLSSLAKDVYSIMFP